MGARNSCEVRSQEYHIETYSTVQYCAVHYGTIPYSTVQNSTDQSTLLSQSTFFPVAALVPLKSKLMLQEEFPEQFTLHIVQYILPYFWGHQCSQVANILEVFPPVPVLLHCTFVSPGEEGTSDTRLVQLHTWQIAIK